MLGTWEDVEFPLNIHALEDSLVQLQPRLRRAFQQRWSTHLDCGHPSCSEVLVGDMDAKLSRSVCMAIVDGYAPFFDYGETLFGFWSQFVSTCACVVQGKFKRVARERQPTKANFANSMLTGYVRVQVTCFIVTLDQAEKVALVTEDFDYGKLQQLKDLYQCQLGANKWVIEKILDKRGSSASGELASLFCPAEMSYYGFPFAVAKPLMLKIQWLYFGADAATWVLAKHVPAFARNQYDLHKPLWLPEDLEVLNSLHVARRAFAREVGSHPLLKLHPEARDLLVNPSRPPTEAMVRDSEGHRVTTARQKEKAEAGKRAAQQAEETKGGDGTDVPREGKCEEAEQGEDPDGGAGAGKLPSCNTDKAIPVRRYKSAGLFAWARACGIIVDLDEAYRAESLPQVLLALLSVCMSLDKFPSVLIYDAGCKLDAFTNNANDTICHPSLKLLAAMKKYVDRLHLKNHKPDCARQFSLDNCELKDADKLNSEVCEQLFAWFSRYKFIVKHMNHGSLLLFAFYMAHLRNLDTEKKIRRRTGEQ